MRTHGLASTYRAVNGCRCVDCCRANTERMRTERNDRRVAMLRGEVDPPHGQLSTYHNYCCRCAACTKANAEYCAEWARRAKASI